MLTGIFLHWPPTPPRQAGLSGYSPDDGYVLALHHNFIQVYFGEPDVFSHNPSNCKCHVQTTHDKILEKHFRKRTFKTTDKLRERPQSTSP